MPVGGGERGAARGSPGPGMRELEGVVMKVKHRRALVMPNTNGSVPPGNGNVTGAQPYSGSTPAARLSSGMAGHAEHAAAIFAFGCTFAPAAWPGSSRRVRSQAPRDRSRPCAEASRLPWPGTDTFRSPHRQFSSARQAPPAGEAHPDRSALHRLYRDDESRWGFQSRENWHEPPRGGELSMLKNKRTAHRRGSVRWG